MPSIQIRDVPAETHAVLRRWAAAAHQSLQEYLRSRLVAEAAVPTFGEVLDRAGGRAGGTLTLDDAAALVRADRDADDDRRPWEWSIRTCWSWPWPTTERTASCGNVTADDAADVALAETLGVPLLTADRRLAAAPGLSGAIEVPAGERSVVAVSAASRRSTLTRVRPTRKDHAY